MRNNKSQNQTKNTHQKKKTPKNVSRKKEIIKIREEMNGGKGKKELVKL